VEVAIKVFKGPEDNGKRARLLREMNVLSSVRHPNIVPILGISDDFDRPLPCIIMPYYRHGAIVDYLRKQPNANKPALLTQTSSALSYLHSLFIIHGDVKGSNILIDDNGEARLTDFSLSRILHAPGFTTMTTSGTWRYMAPELVEICEKESAEGEEEEESSLNPATTDSWRWKAPEQMEAATALTCAADVWGFAMMVMEIWTGAAPFSYIRGDASVIHHVISGGRPKRYYCQQISDEVWGVLEKCWDIDPGLRPSMASLTHFFALQANSATAERARL
jgi:serine/threonine protein kinase